MIALLPISLPPMPERTRDSLPAAVARRIGPLFGLFEPETSPYSRSWVVDVRRVLVKELAQGRPDEPTGKYVTSGVGGREGRQNDSPRMAPSGEKPLAPATIAKFGPDPRAAMVLEGVNTLLAQRTEQLWEVIKFELDWTFADPTHGKDVRVLRSQVARALAFWAIGIGELWSSYPALIWAGFWARNLQRSGDFDVRYAPEAAETAAPSEYGSTPKRFQNDPSTLNVMDDVLQRLQNYRYEDKYHTPVVNRHDLPWFNDAADKLADVMSSVAQEDGNHPGVVWVPKLPRQEERVATAYLVPIHVIREFARRHNLDRSGIASAWDGKSDSVRRKLAAASTELSKPAFAWYVRILEVALEWSSRGENDAKLSKSRHAEVQRWVAEASRSTMLRPTEPEVDSLSTTSQAAAEAIVLFSEARAEACQVRALVEKGDGEELRGSVTRLLAHLDAVRTGTLARRLPTGPALAQLSRGTSDAFDALSECGNSDDAFWIQVHAKVGGYWEAYRSLLSEGVRSDGMGGPVNHYLGNIAGYLAAVELAPETANRGLMLEQALDLLSSQIIPYRKRRAEGRADWEEFLVRGYLQAAECAYGLAKAAAGVSPETLAYNRGLARNWLIESEGVLKNYRDHRTTLDKKLIAKQEELKSKLEAL